MKTLGNLYGQEHINLHLSDYRTTRNCLAFYQPAKMSVTQYFVHLPSWYGLPLRVKGKMYMAVRRDSANRTIGVDYSEVLALDVVESDALASIAVALRPRGVVNHTNPRLVGECLTTSKYSITKYN